MDDINWEKERINLCGLALQGILEREQSWLSKTISDVMYKRLAHHCVSIADAIIEELQNKK